MKTHAEFVDGPSARQVDGVTVGDGGGRGNGSERPRPGTPSKSPHTYISSVTRAPVSAESAVAAAKAAKMASGGGMEGVGGDWGRGFALSLEPAAGYA